MGESTIENPMDCEYLYGTRVDLTYPDLVFNVIKNYPYKESNYICFFGLYPLAQSMKNKAFQKVLNESWLNPLHGKAIEMYLRLKGHKNIRTTDGAFLLRKLLREPVSHYFYGANNDTLLKIKEKIAAGYPDATICGYKEPPRVDLDNLVNHEQLREDFMEINRLHPHIVWVGLGGVKQDLVMHHYMKYLDDSLLIGVGAVFDYFAGNIRLSSEKTKSMGFRWLQRLLQQPRLLIKQLESIGILIRSLFKKRR